MPNLEREQIPSYSLLLFPVNRTQIIIIHNEQKILKKKKKKTAEDIEAKSN